MEQLIRYLRLSAAVIVVILVLGTAAAGGIWVFLAVVVLGGNAVLMLRKHREAGAAAATPPAPYEPAPTHSQQAPRGRPSRARPARVPPVGFSLNDLTARVPDERTMLRAWDVLRRSKLYDVEIDSDEDYSTFCCQAGGSGGELYDITLYDDLHGQCDCKSFERIDPALCKHLAAAGLLWLERAHGESPEPEDLDRAAGDALSGLSADELRALLLECAGKEGRVRRRIIGGTWR